MSTLRARRNTERALASGLRFDSANMYVHLTDGRQISVPLDRFPRLQKATPEQREEWELIGPGVGIHWEEIDEDISVENLLADPASLLVYK